MGDGRERDKHASYCTCELCGLYDRVAKIESFSPTAEQINALPKRLRVYIRDLETVCDPAGDVQELTLTRDQNKQLGVLVKDLETQIAEFEMEDARVTNAGLRIIIERLRDALDMGECSHGGGDLTCDCYPCRGRRALVGAQ